MKNTDKTPGIDTEIRTDAREPDRYAFEDPKDEREPSQADPFEPVEEGNPYPQMTDAALAGAVVFYEREHTFARAQDERKRAKFQMNRAQAEIAHRKIATRNAADKTFAGQAANDLEADHVVFPAQAAA